MYPSDKDTGSPINALDNVHKSPSGINIATVKGRDDSFVSPMRMVIGMVVGFMIVVDLFSIISYIVYSILLELLGSG